MNVELVLAGPIKRPEGLIGGVPGNPAVLDLPETCTVAQMAQTLGFDPQWYRFFRVAVNGEMVSMDHLLNQGDSVTLMLPVGGG